MTRLIEIIDEKLNDNLSVSEISSVDLPLEVYIINDQADRVKTRIIISTMGSNKDENKIEEEEENKTVLGHISQDEENIFFQPSDNLSIPIFHNDEVITI